MCSGASDRKEIEADVPAPFPFSEKPDFENFVKKATIFELHQT